jgi:hypothetical protein
MLLLYALVLASVSGHNYTYVHGALPAGDDLQKGNHTFEQASKVTMCNTCPTRNHVQYLNALLYI